MISLYSYVAVDAFFLNCTNIEVKKYLWLRYS